MPEYLFVYGTLHPDRAPRQIAATVRKLRLVGPATIRGRKYQFSHYPALIITGTQDEDVSGTVFELPDDPAVLTAIDAYEDFRPATPAHSLFLRQRHPVAMPGGAELQCWVYVYNQPLPVFGCKAKAPPPEAG